MADVSAIRAALAAQITAKTGLRALGDAPGQVNPPVAVILPGTPFVHFGDTFDGSLTVNLRVLLILSDAPPVERVQRALDAYLGIGGDTTTALIPGAIMADPTLGGVAQWCMPMAVSTYHTIEYAKETYFGARLEVQVGAIFGAI